MKLLKTATILIVVSITYMTFIFVLSGCLSTRYWDGWVSREVIVTVLDENSTNPISDATVTLQNLNLPKELELKCILNDKTDQDGVAKLSVYFSGGGRKHLFGSEGNYGISGDLTITADGYTTLAVPLASLAGAEPKSTEDKSAVRVRISLERKDF
jgi:hypothetical protein